MPYKLDQIREIVGRAPKSYPKTKHLVDDGVYDIGVLDRAMREDLFSFTTDDFVPLNPFNQKVIASVSMDDLEESLAREDFAKEAGRTLAKKAIAQPGMKSCRQCINFIQDHGRNSEASQELVNNLRVTYDTLHPYVKHNLESGKRKSKVST